MAEEKKEKKPRAKRSTKKIEEKHDDKEVALIPQIEPVQVPVTFKSKITKQQLEVIKTQIAKGASDDELKMFLYVCERTGLDPFTKQVHLVPRWDGKLGKEVRGIIVGIDGLRSVAERTGAYAGNSDPIMGESKSIKYKVNQGSRQAPKWIEEIMDVPTMATVTVKKVVQGVICDFTASAKWDEYYPGDAQGIMWRKMPDNMLGKCAEAKALRKAFPAVMSGLYVAEEMQQAQATPEQIEAARKAAAFNQAKAAFMRETDQAKLAEYRDKVDSSTVYNDEQKAELFAIIDAKIEA